MNYLCILFLLYDVAVLYTATFPRYGRAPLKPHVDVPQPTISADMRALLDVRISVPITCNVSLSFTMQDMLCSWGRQMQSEPQLELGRLGKHGRKAVSLLLPLGRKICNSENPVNPDLRWRHLLGEWWDHQSSFSDPLCSLWSLWEATHHWSSGVDLQGAGFGDFLKNSLVWKTTRNHQ